MESSEVALLGPAEVRALAAEAGVRPTKKLGQNFVHDQNTVRRIVELAGVDETETVLEVGPGLGSLTLGLLETGASVVAVEFDERLAGRLPGTVRERTPSRAGALTVHTRDASRVTADDLEREPSVLVANLPYNVAVPVVLHLLAELPSLRRALVMVQVEVADRMAASPGNRVYGVPSAKLAFFGHARKVGAVPRSVFWPMPNVDSALVAFERADAGQSVDRTTFFAVVDAAFAQRRKTLRSALIPWAGTVRQAEAALRAAGIDPRARGEQLTAADFTRLARVRAP